MIASKKRLRIARRKFTAIFFVITLVLLGGGYWYYQTQSSVIRAREYANIAAIAKMKADQILQWRKERIMDVAREAVSPGYIDPLGKIAEHTETPAVMDRMLQAMVMARNGIMYSHAFVISPTFEVLLSSGDGPVSVDPCTRNAATAALASPRGVISDFFSSQGKVYVDTVQAVRDAGGNTLGFIVLRSRANDFLYRLIQSWPTPSDTAEALLVERQGDEVVFLNELRHRSQAPLSLRLSLQQTELPCVQAILGHQGMFEGRDYRGKEVLANLRAIPGTKWFMITKVDRDEILAEAQNRAVGTCLAVGGLILLAAAATASAYARRQAGLFRQLFELERQEKESQEQFRITLYSIGDGVLTTDTEGRVREMNPVAERLTGWTEAEARGKPLEEVFVIVNQETRVTVINPVSIALRDKKVVGLANHTLLIARDGTEHAIADSAAPIRDDSGAVNGVVLVFSNVTEQYQMREKLLRSERDYRMLFEGMLEGFALHEIICDADGKPVDYRYLSINPAFEQMTGLRIADTIGRTVREILPGIEPFWIERYGHVALTGQPTYFEDYSSLLKRYYKIMAFRPQPGQFAVVCEDITERKQAEVRIARLSQLYAALSQCNQAIVHATSLENLLPQICRDVVQFGGMCMAWIGLLDEATEKIRPAALFGSGIEYLENIEISVNPNEPEGCGPTGVSLRENTPVWCQDYQNDPTTEPWRQQGIRYGWAASASLPLRRKGKPVGALVLYTDKAQAFDEEVRKLLEEMAHDISFALDNFDREAERKQAEAALRESEIFLRESQSIANLGNFVTDLSLGLWRSSEVLDKVFGIDSTYERSVEGWLALVHPEDRQILEDYLKNEVLGLGRTFDKEYRIVRQNDQAERWVHGMGKLEFDAQGTPSKMLGTIQDITERKQAEDALQQNRDMLAHVLNSVPQSIFWKDCNSTYLGCNEVFAREAGFASPEEVIGKTDFDLSWVKEDAKGYIADDREVMETKQAKRHFIESEQLPDGTRIWVDTTKVPLTDSAGNVHGVLGIYENITERKQSEETLHIIHSAIESSIGAIALGDMEGKVAYVNPACVRLWGFEDKSEMLGRPILDFWAKPENVLHIMEVVSQGGTENSERVAKKKDGTFFDVNISVNLVRDESGKPACILLSAMDITERKRVEARLQLQSGALEAAANAIVITNNKGVIEWANSAFTTFTGYTLDEAIGQTHRMLNSGEHDPAFYQDLWKTVLAGEVWQGEITNRRKSGSLYTEEMTITPLKKSQGEVTHFIAVKQDITERKQMEANLLRTQRMESIGTLASGVAHDINNILSPIILSADMLRTTDDADLRENLLCTIEECAQRGANVVNQVLTFARGAKGERIHLQLARQIGDMEKIMHETFPRNISVTTSIPAELWNVKADPTQVHQILLNLCINARDAMPHGGTLHIAAENREIDENFAAMVSDAKPGDHVMLAISDSGIGIPQAIINKIFDPFFTTKEIGKGTGLGLSTVLGIARSHGGFVTVESEEGHGSTFKLFLPRETSDMPEPLHPARNKAPQGAGGTVLIVDDEADIAKVTTIVLEKNGYKVLTAADGTEALALYKKHASEIKLILTDIMMPGMDGVELARALKEIDPQVKIIASTGQAAETHQAELRALGIRAILHKPYDARKLLSALHTTLHSDHA